MKNLPLEDSGNDKSCKYTVLQAKEDLINCQDFNLLERKWGWDYQEIKDFFKKLEYCVNEVKCIHSAPEIEMPLEREEIIFQEWNKIEGIKQSRFLSPSRKKIMKTRLKDKFWREGWREGLVKVQESDYCHGAGRDGWVATLDWFLKPDTLTKLLEDFYGNRKQQRCRQAAGNVAEDKSRRPKYDGPSARVLDVDSL